MQKFKTNIQWILAAQLIFLASLAHAEDVYNFYFQKSPKETEEVKTEKKEEVKTESEETVHYYEDDDILLIPDNWKPAKAEKKVKYIYKPSEDEQIPQAIRYEASPKKEKGKEDYKKWTAQLGLGSLVGFSPVYGKYAQRTYNIGMRYNMSKYFDVNGELYLPNGEAEPESYYYNPSNPAFFYGTSEQKSSGTIGLGITPIHLALFGAQFLELGVDGGVVFGDRITNNGLETNESSIFLGPRVAVNFSNRFGLVYSYKRDTKYSEHSNSSLTLSYSW